MYIIYVYIYMYIYICICIAVIVITVVIYDAKSILWETKITMGNQHFSCGNQGTTWAIFNSSVYVDQRVIMVNDGTPAGIPACL